MSLDNEIDSLMESFGQISLGEDGITWDPKESEAAMEGARRLMEPYNKKQQAFLEGAKENAERVKRGLEPVRGLEPPPGPPKRGRGRPRKVQVGE